MCKIFDAIKLKFQEDLKSGKIKEENLVEVDDIVFAYRGKPVEPFEFKDKYSIMAGLGDIEVLYGEFLPNYRIRFYSAFDLRKTTTTIKFNPANNYYYFDGGGLHWWGRQILLTEKGVEKMKKINREE